MKTRARLFALLLILVPGSAGLTIQAQDTIYTGAFPSPEAFKELTEQLRIMEFTLQENLKDLEFNADSLAFNLDRLRMDLENLPRPLIPEDFMYDLQENLLMFQEDFLKDFQEENYFHFQEDFMRDFDENFQKRFFATTVDLEAESGKKEVIINVEEEIPVLYININGGIKTGNVKVEIFDPEGKKQGSFYIENTDINSKDAVNGSLNKNINMPLTGNWKVMINSEKASGHIFISSMQHPQMIHVR